MAPRIGICSFQDTKNEADFNSINKNYTRSVSAAGGLPFIIPYLLTPEEANGMVEALDGLLLSGGVDIAPYHYGEDPMPSVKRISGVRDSTELALFSAARARGLPVFGICRGCQMINVAMGGTLYQDIPSQLPGSNAHYPEGLPMDELFHDITLSEPDSLISRAFAKSRIKTNSFHHQAVKTLAPSLVCTAQSSDGIIEAIEGTDSNWFLMAVQFHPEGLSARYPEFVELFRLHVAAAEKFGKK